MSAWSWLQGGGEMGALIRSTDWASTPVGPVESWSPSLRMMVRFLLANRFPLLLWWGPQYASIYNDAYIPVLGKKHPWALGLPVSECWSEIWHILQPLIDTPFHGGPSTWNEDIALEINRHGFTEETHFTIAYSPVPDETTPTGIGGVLATVHEITGTIVGERRVVTLRDLGVQLAETKTADDTCRVAAQVLSNHGLDVPFAELYLLDDGSTPRLAGGTAAPGRDWPMAEAIRTGQMQVVTPLDAHFDVIPAGPWSDPPASAVVMSIPSSRAGEAAGVLVAGVSSRLKLDPYYRDFLELVRARIATAIGNARAYEEERRRAEALADIDRAKTAFFSNVSHEFRTPLTLLVGPIEDALADTAAPLSGVQRERQEIAHRNALRLLRLVNTLLDFSRLEAGRIDANYEPTDLAALTVELASQFQSAVERAGLVLTVDCAPMDDPVHVDRDMWEKIVLNLLSNALKFTFEGQIRVALRPAGDVVELAVSDTGVGIPAADLPRMFERFHRVKNSRARTHEGTGIGLALVQELARLHGGDVRVSSTEGRGTTFTVTVRRGTQHLPADRLPVARTLESTKVGAAPFVEEALRWLGDANLPPHEAASRAGADAARVLIADDNADMRAYLARILGQSYRIEAVADGRTALDRIAADPPDLVLADVMMPDLDGFGLLAAVRTRPATRSLPFVLLSARAGEEARIEGLRAGADEYLVKPFSARELHACVASQLQLAAIRREAERERTKVLEEASQIKDDFLASLSHELRTPLSAILGYARLLRSNVIAQDKVPKAIETIERNATSLTQIVEDVLDISRIVSGKLRLKVQPVDVPQIVRVAVDAVAPAADAKGIRVETILDPQAAPISGDPERLQQIIWNLLTNAVKFTARGGKVQVRLARVNSSVEFAVSDTGIGIAPEFLPHVFERFRQADVGIARERGGLGLGLSIARQLTEMHGGTIEAFSGGVGQGSTFRVTLPLMILHPAAEQGLRVHPRADQAPGTTTVVDLRGVHVLVVDDERDALSLVAEVLQGAGAEVKTADSAQRGLAALDARVPDVIVADLGMPHMDGYQFIDRIRKHPNPNVKNVPAAALTAYARSEDRVRALTAGFHIHLIKPIDPAELVTTVATLARRFSLR